MGETNRGFLVLADISGYTAFVTATELEHGPPIVAALLEEVIGRISPPLDVLQVAARALQAYGPARMEALSASATEAREEPRRRARLRRQRDEAGCDGCARHRVAPRACSAMRSRFQRTSPSSVSEALARL